MSISYHELAASSNQNSKVVQDQNRKYYLVLCVLGFGVFFHATIRAGIFESVAIDGDHGIYPGGSFVFKEIVRDYVASGGVMRMIENDLIKAFESLTDDGNENTTTPIVKEGDADEYLYSIFVDNLDKDSRVVPDADKRFFAGIVTDKAGKEMKDILLNYANNIRKKKVDDLNRMEELEELPYHVGKLPSVRAAVATFPYTGGFISALLNQYKVFPALVGYIKKNHSKTSNIVIVSSCNAAKKLCHHYVPMTKTNDFLLGRPESAVYAKSLTDTPLIDMKPFMKGLKRVLGVSKKKKSKDTAQEDNEEL